MRWRKVAGGVLGGAAGLLLGLCAWGWIWVFLALPVPLEDVGYLALGTVLALALAGVLYWLGKRLEG